MSFLVLSVLSYLVQDFSNKKFSLSVGRASFGTALVQNAVACICSFFTLVLTGRVTLLSQTAALLAVLFGISFLGTVFLLLCAFMHGTVGLSTLICNIGTFVAVFWGVIRFEDAFTPLIAGGFLCMLLAVILSTPFGKNEQKGGLKWFLFAIGSGLCNGIVASVKREAVGIISDNVESFLAFGFLFAGLFAIAFAFCFRENRRDAIRVIKHPLNIVWGVFAGVGGVLANLFQMLALKTVPSTVVYPLTSGVLVVTLWLASLLIYKETKAKPGNVLALVFCLLAILLVNL